MQSERKSPLLIFGIPLGNWYPLADSILKETRLQGEDPYENWHRDLFGVGATELKVGLSMIDLQKLEIPAQFKSKVEKLAEDGAANSGLAGASAYGCWTADYWLKTLPSATGLVFYEHPSRMIRRYHATDPSASIEALLSIWSAAAQKIIFAVRRHRDRVYLLNIAECLKSEGKFVPWAQKHLGITPDIDGGARASLKEETGLNALTEILCSENSLITNLVQELDVSAQLIDDEWGSSISGEIAKSTVATLTELPDLRRKSDEFAARDREKENDKDPALRKEKETLSTYERLLTELHQAFQESECFFEKWKRAESSGRELSLKVDSVIRGDLREESEHRHINYTFQGVGLFARHWPILHLRLVRHRGHAGIAIFASKDSERPPLYGWEPTGSENNTPFRLFVPADAPARDALVRATASDLVLIMDSVSLIHADIRMHGLPENCHTPWIYVAERLLEEINDLPERLHYDSVKTDLNPVAGREPRFFFDVINAGFRGRIFSSLKLSWSPSLIGGRLGISLPDSGHPPFSYWPQAVDGKFIDVLEYSTWKYFNEGGRRLLEKFTQKDKAFLRIIISEIPNFLVHASQQHPTNNFGLKHLNK